MGTLTFTNLHGIPCRWVICPRCEGNGQTENPAFDNGFTGEEWGQMDYEEREDYLAGVYDVPCPDCNSTGKVREPDVARCTYAQKRALAEERREAREHAIWDAEDRAVRRMEEGWR